jgi:hypothetical protein
MAGDTSELSLPRTQSAGDDEGMHPLAPGTRVGEWRVRAWQGQGSTVSCTEPSARASAHLEPAGRAANEALSMISSPSNVNPVRGVCSALRG